VQIKNVLLLKNEKMIKLFTIYIVLGLVWRFSFDWIVHRTLKEKYFVSLIPILGHILIWPVFLGFFIWGMFFRK